MSKRLGITEQQRINDALIEELRNGEDAINDLFIVNDHLQRIIHSIPARRSLGKPLSDWYLSLHEVSTTYDGLIKVRPLLCRPFLRKPRLSRPKERKPRQRH